MPLTRAADPETIRQALGEVYGAREFWWKHRRELDTFTIPLPDLTKLFQPLVEKVGQLLGRFLEWLERLVEWFAGLSPLPRGAPASELSWACLLLTVVTALGIGAWLLLRRGAVDRLASETDSPLTSHPPQRDAETFLAQARQAFEKGDYAQVLRNGLLAVLMALDDRGVVPFDPARTNREYAAAFRRWPEASEEFRRLASAFDRVHYGHASIDRKGAMEELARSVRLVQFVGAWSRGTTS